MKSLLPSAPVERLFEGGDDVSDGLNSLRLLRDRYIKASNLDAASRVAALIGDTAVADEPITSDEGV
jgi:hypothetical protein